MRNLVFDFNDNDPEPYYVILQTLDDVMRVVDGVRAVIKRFGHVTLSDLKNLLGLPTTYEDTKIGWVNLSHVTTESRHDNNIKVVFPPTNWSID